jgi:cardiolipin synthase A/B
MAQLYDMRLDKRKKKDTGYHLQQQVALIRGGEPYFTLLLRLIADASHSIHLQTYILADDATGRMVADALKGAVARGVTVYLMADGYASQGLPDAWVESLREAGIQFRFFEPLFKGSYFYVGRRMHHKLFVVDGYRALVGGINIADHYNDMPGKAAWLDFALLVEGPIAGELCLLCWKTWNGFSVPSGPLPCPPVPMADKGNEAPAVRMRRNDWVRRKNEISTTYAELFNSATSHVTIVCSYFLPAVFLRRLMRRAAARGVKIRVVTAGRSDVMVAKAAERWLYDWLLRHHIELYEYQPTVLHAKIAVCDGKWLTVGSYNINKISAYASVELNLDVYHPAFAVQTEQVLQGLIDEHCVRIEPELHRSRTGIFRQLGRWMAYGFIRIMVYMFTFYYKRRSLRPKGPDPSA